VAKRPLRQTPLCVSRLRELTRMNARTILKGGYDLGILIEEAFNLLQSELPFAQARALSILIDHAEDLKREVDRLKSDCSVVTT
jgi:hypothetical protein